MRFRVALVVTALLATLVAAAPTASARPLRVVVYGDSLTTEATPYLHGIVNQVAGSDVLVRGAPGGATCDLFDLMAHDARTVRPAFVVVQFSGNNLTACMQDRQGRALTGAAWLAKYRADTIRAIQLLRPMRAPIWLATSPISMLAERQGAEDVHRLAAMFREVAASRPGVHVTDAGRAVLDGGRHWSRTLPCLPSEPCYGGVDTSARRANIVRAPDGAHFCPTPKASPTADCPVWSSGALRFALGLVVVPLQSARMFDRARFDRTSGAGWSP